MAIPSLFSAFHLGQRREGGWGIYDDAFSAWIYLTLQKGGLGSRTLQSGYPVVSVNIEESCRNHAAASPSRQRFVDVASPRRPISQYLWRVWPRDGRDWGEDERR